VVSYFLGCMRHGGVHADAVCCANAMSSCLKGLEWEASMSFHRQMYMDGTEPDLVCKGAVLTVCKQLHVWQRALAFLSSAFTGREPPPNDICFNATLASMATADQWEACMTLLAAVECQLQRPDAVTYGALLPAFERRRSWAEALALLVAPEVGISAFNAASSICEKAGVWLTALDLCSLRMPSRRLEPDLITFNAVTSA
ncbi:unnamed protein product, partial [Symbiodinium microadriaticum]